MSTLNAAVTSGKVFTKDAQGRALVTLDDLNKMGVPTVTVDIANKVATADIVDAAVTKLKLENDLADAMLLATATVGASVAGGNPIVVTLQLTDIQGNVLTSTYCGVRWWLSDAAFAPAAIAPTATVPTTITHTNGYSVIAAAANITAFSITDATGLLKLTMTHATALTRYFYAVVGGKLIQGSINVKWT